MFFISSAFLTLVLLPLAGCNHTTEPASSGGPTWVAYTRAGTGGGLVNDRINGIFIDASNRKWFATDFGASAFSRNSWTTLSSELQYTTYFSGGSTISRKVNCVAQALDGTLWFGLAGGGIRRMSSSGGSHPIGVYTTSTGLSANEVLQISPDHLGDVWCATTYGISHFRPSADDPVLGVWETFEPPNPLPTGFVRSVRANFSTYLVWFGTDYGDLVSYDGSTQWNFTRAPENASPIAAIAHDNANRVWVATNDGAFSYSPTAGWRSYTVETTGGGLPSPTVTALVTDSKGSKWFGTNHGLARLNDDGWKVYNRHNSPLLPSDTITALAIDVRRNIWIGTPKGAAVFNEEGVE